MQRAINTYREKGYSEEWITQRIRTIETRKELTAEWNRVRVNEGIEYAILTDDISKAWSGMSTKEYKQYKGNLDILNRYKPNKLYWQITNDIEKTKQILAPYTGEDFVNDIFLKDLVKYNLLGQYINMCGFLYNRYNKGGKTSCIKYFFNLKFIKNTPYSPIFILNIQLE